MSCIVRVNKTEMGKHNLIVDFFQFIIYLPMNESVASLAG